MRQSYSASIECPLCEKTKLRYMEETITLRKCSHTFCKKCLLFAFDRKWSTDLKCPAENCKQKVSFRDKFELLTPENYFDYIAKQNSKTSTVEDFEEFPFVENLEKFECSHCSMEINPGGGLKLINCHHRYCKLCLVSMIESSEMSSLYYTVACPFNLKDRKKCKGFLLESELEYLKSFRQTLLPLVETYSDLKNLFSKCNIHEENICQGFDSIQLNQTNHERFFDESSEVEEDAQLLQIRMKARIVKPVDRSRSNRKISSKSLH